MADRSNAKKPPRDEGPHSERKQSQRPTPSDAEWAKLSQREKFIRTAREVEADETGEALDEALKAIGRARKRP